ncbi:hypothetical protein GPECTOR_12g488 [Gonium pectorale]|uniref:Uncharacterized protein n=1 Tax=Gonium pectorale TaxID=33097 RepID=A0A150GP11_GONPE|nr:hypothetical protein GPECTOR_12g488 [Gonium pectorale]|eukprot:KXZ51525.1 hypothetical protein GPECTOR_12g488 [Gonium pectorale]
MIEGKTKEMKAEFDQRISEKDESIKQLTEQNTALAKDLTLNAAHNLAVCHEPSNLFSAEFVGKYEERLTPKLETTTGKFASGEKNFGEVQQDVAREVDEKLIKQQKERGE